MLALVLLTAVRLAVAATTPLAPDEAYYWVWSRALQAGYLDHPPMVALWIRAGTALAGETALGVRLLAPLAALAGSLLLADAAERLFPGRGAGVPAAVLLNATVMLGVGAVLMTPDTPLLFFAVLTLWALARVADDRRWWLLAGAAVGLALDSKYTGVLLALAVPAWLLWAAPRELRRTWPWVGGAVAALLFLPVVVWNAEHGWASFLKQGGRTGEWQPARAAGFLLELVGAQVGLATPGVFALFVGGCIRAGRAALRRDAAATLLLALVLPGLLIFTEHAFGDRVQANWLAILYPPLAVAAGLARARWWRWAAGFGLVLSAMVYLQAAVAPLTLPRRFDPTLQRLAGWDGLTQAADAERRARGLAFLAADEYGEAALLAWWAPAGTEVVGAEARWTLFRLERPEAAAGLLLVSDRRRNGPDPALWSEASEVGHLVRSRAGVEAEGFKVYLVRLRPGVAAAVLPRRTAGGE